jgi:poly-gamma-glutamate capsule biosynthesis protein CapA/YwtB (metallophosphatase superfamily)
VRLAANNIAALGAAETMDGAFAPQFFTTRDGRRAALIALTDIENGFDAKGATVATASNRELVARGIAEARASAEFVLCLMHWGDENTAGVSERQRTLARWLIDQGVDAVAGCHSHSIQPLDFYHGRPVVYSLGNLIFDGAPNLESWNKGQLLEVDLGGRGRESSIRLIPIRLDARGFPQVASGPEEGPAGNDTAEYFH